MVPYPQPPTSHTLVPVPTVAAYICDKGKEMALARCELKKKAHTLQITDFRARRGSAAAPRPLTCLPSLALFS